MGTSNLIPRKGGGGGGTVIPDSTPDGTLLLVRGGKFEVSSLSETSSKVISDKTIQTPPGSLELGTDLHISSANHGISIQNKALGKYALLNGQVWDPKAGVSRFIEYQTNEKSVIIAQPDISHTIGAREDGKYFIFYDHTIMQTSIISAMIFWFEPETNIKNLKMTVTLTDDKNAVINISNFYDVKEGRQVLKLLNSEGGFAPMLVTAGELMTFRLECDVPFALMGNGDRIPYSGVERNVLSYATPSAWESCEVVGPQVPCLVDPYWANGEL